MELREFIKQNRGPWEQLEQSIREMSKRKSLTPRHVENFQILYRQALNHLSYSQTYFPDEEVTAYLNALVAKAHNLLYRGQAATSWHQLKQFFGKTFIRLLLEQRRFFFTAMLLFLIGGVGSFLAVLNDPLHLYSILPPSIAAGVDPAHLGQGKQLIDAPAMSAQIMTNNIQVAILAFAGGLTFGILTIYLLISNGILLGALAALFWQYGKFYDFWAYIVPHGMIELTAIFIAGGSGLLMGYRLLVPGPYSRIYQLKNQAARSVQLLLGTIPLFIVAGTIEGYITPAPIPLQAKYGVALLTVIGLGLYVWLGGRRRDREPATISRG